MKKEILPNKTSRKKKKSLNPAHIPKNSQITLTAKLRLKDCLVWDKKVRSILYLITNQPVRLWNRIHKRKPDEKKVSLVRPAYALLKSEVKKIDSTLVDNVNKQHNQHKAYRKLRKEVSKGVFGGENSRFKKISSSEIVK